MYTSAGQGGSAAQRQSSPLMFMDAAGLKPAPTFIRIRAQVQRFNMVSMNDNAAQRNSASFRLPALDADFLLGDSMRGVRLQLEYEKVEERLRAWVVRSTIVVFGSARVLPRGSDDPDVSSATLPAGAAPRPGERSAHWYEEARKFGRIASERGGALISDHGIRDNVIATGGGPGIMEAANRGAADAGAPSIGFNIGLPLEQQPNAYSTPDLTFQFHYFAIRKLHFAMRANALVIFPGGFGTLDELFESLVLIQTGKIHHFPVVLVGTEHWDGLRDWVEEKLIAEKLIAPADVLLLTLTDDAAEAVEIVRDCYEHSCAHIVGDAEAAAS
jgi:uncharacterized protein (TIGR00730 family)